MLYPMEATVTDDSLASPVDDTSGDSDHPPLLFTPLHRRVTRPALQGKGGEEVSARESEKNVVGRGVRPFLSTGNTRSLKYARWQW